MFRHIEDMANRNNDMSFDGHVFIFVHTITGRQTCSEVNQQLSNELLCCNTKSIPTTAHIPTERMILPWYLRFKANKTDFCRVCGHSRGFFLRRFLWIVARSQYRFLARCDAQMDQDAKEKLETAKQTHQKYGNEHTHQTKL